MKQHSEERMLPQNLDAERGVLGSCLIDPEAIYLIADRLKPEHFYRSAHRTIYEMMLELSAQRHAPTDYIMLCDALEQAGKLDDIGGPGLLGTLVNYVPTSGNVEYYASIVHREAVLRQLVKASGEIATLAFQDFTEEEALELAQQIVYDIGSGHALSDFASDEQIMSTVWANLEEAARTKKRITGLSTGFPDLDFALGGLQKSDLIILAARTAVGKSSFAMSIAHHIAHREEQGVAVFHLEMPKEQVMQRILSMDSGVPIQRMRTGWIEDDEWEKLVESTGRLRTGRLWIDDTPGLTLMQLRSKLRKLMARTPVSIVIIDYLQLMVGSLAGKQNRAEEVGELSRGLKQIAKEFNVPVLALAQLNRAAENSASKVPQLTHLRESGSIEQDADVVLFIYREELYNPDTERKNIADIIIAKQRNGALGEVSVYFDAPRTMFRPLEVLLEGGAHE